MPGYGATSMAQDFVPCQGKDGLYIRQRANGLFEPARLYWSVRLNGRLCILRRPRSSPSQAQRRLHRRRTRILPQPCADDRPPAPDRARARRCSCAPRRCAAQTGRPHYRYRLTDDGHRSTLDGHDRMLALLVEQVGLLGAGRRRRAHAGERRARAVPRRRLSARRAPPRRGASARRAPSALTASSRSCARTAASPSGTSWATRCEVRDFGCVYRAVVGRRRPVRLARDLPLSAAGCSNTSQRREPARLRRLLPLPHPRHGAALRRAIEATTDEPSPNRTS